MLPRKCLSQEAAQKTYSHVCWHEPFTQLQVSCTLWFFIHKVRGLYKMLFFLLNFKMMKGTEFMLDEWEIEMFNWRGQGTHGNAANDRNQ